MLRQYYGIIGVSVAFLVHFVAAQIPYSIISFIYTHGLFPIFKWVLSPFSILPIPSLWVFIIGLLALVIRSIRRYQKGASLVRTGLAVLNYLGIFIMLFYLLWAFNYRSRPIRDYLPVEALNIDSLLLKQLYHQTTEDLIQLRQICPDTFNDELWNLSDLQGEILRTQKPFLEEFDFPVHLPSKVKFLPAGMLLRLSTAGFYFPLGGEGYVDRALHPIVLPHVVAHELAHNFGVTDEGEANFIALRTCLSSEDAMIRYSGLLDLWRYVSSALYQLNPEEQKKIVETLPETIKKDIQSIRDRHNQYPDILPTVRDFIYDRYLKTQGVSSGLASYSEIIILELAYRQRQLSN